MSKDLMEEIVEYTTKRQYKMPSIWEAMAWVNTEIAEVYEVMLSTGGWVRNNPQDHPERGKEELAEELGDIIFMVMLAGYAEGVNPLEAMKNKMKRKLSEKVATGVSRAEPVDNQELDDWLEELRED